jgi:hypothetical protein
MVCNRARKSFGPFINLKKGLSTNARGTPRPRMCYMCGRTMTKWMVAYLKAFVAFLKVYVFSKFSDWQSMKCSPGALWHRMTHVGPLTGALLCRRFHACPR